MNPGFINLKLNPEFLAAYLDKMQADENLSLEKAKEPKKIIIDYGGPNVAKPLHVGHLRSAIIGESIKRMGRFWAMRSSETCIWATGACRWDSSSWS